MVDRSEKNNHSLRQDRQFRPVLNSIIFLIAANLVAKGALGLGTYQAPTLPGNIQGSLFLSLNAPSTAHQAQAQAQQYLPLWFPVSNQLGSTQPPRPITQTQIVNIGEPYEEVEYENIKEGPFSQKLFVNRYNSIEDQLEAASSDEVEVKTKPEISTTEVNPEETTTITSTTTTTNTDDDVEILPQNFTNIDNNSQEVARQDVTPTTKPTTVTTSTTKPTTTTTARPTSLPTETASSNTTNSTAAGNNTGYGPPNGYDNVSFTYGPPIGGNITGNISRQNNTNTNNTQPGYSYLPAGDYGPYTGNENISITYGPPVYQRPIYENPIYQRPVYEKPVYQKPIYQQKPFFSSPEDPYLNHYNQYYNNFYNNPAPSYSYSDMYKYSDYFKDYFNKFDYNNYPSSFYNNYLGK